MECNRDGPAVGNLGVKRLDSVLCGSELFELQ